jgi:hypothetical protein
VIVGKYGNYVLLRAKNSGRQCHFKIWLDCHKLKIFPCLIMPMSTKWKKKLEKMTINVIQHDDRLWYLRPFYNGAFSVVSKHDFDNKFFFFARDSTRIYVATVWVGDSWHLYDISYTFIWFFLYHCTLTWQFSKLRDYELSKKCQLYPTYRVATYIFVHSCHTYPQSFWY